MNSVKERLVNGIVKENPTFVLMLGMCPTLAVTTSAINGLGMGLTTMVVLALSNAFISLLRNVIPGKVRIPAFIVIMAPGAFFVLSVLTAIQNKVKIVGERKGKDMSKIQSGCGSDCMNCSDTGCRKRIYDEKGEGEKTNA